MTAVLSQLLHYQHTVWPPTHIHGHLFSPVAYWRPHHTAVNRTTFTSSLTFVCENVRQPGRTMTRHVIGTIGSRTTRVDHLFRQDVTCQP